jgi:hypothetical protein
MNQARRNILLGILIGTAYGLGIRLLIAVTEKSSSTLLGGVSLGFLCFGPLAIGYLTTRMHPDPGWGYRLFAPWLPVAIGTAVTALTGVEGWACIVMGLPILLPMSTVGGLLGTWVRPRSPLPVAAFTLLPFVSGGIERGIPEPVALRTVESDRDQGLARTRVDDDRPGAADRARGHPRRALSPHGIPAADRRDDRRGRGRGPACFPPPATSYSMKP